MRGFSTELCSLLQGENPPLVASVGPATTEELAQRHHRVDLEAQPHTGRALAELLDSQLRPGLPVLVPQGDVGGGELVSRLAELERPFLPHVVYQNVAPNFEPIEPFPVAAVFVAAPSAARRLIAHYPWIAQAPFLPIGPTTHAALEELGVRRFLGPIEAPGQGVDWRLWTQRRQADILAAAWREHASSIPDDPDFQR